MPATTSNVGEMLCRNLAVEKAKNQHCLLKVLSSLRFLARQGCALKCHEEKEGNLMQLMMLISESDSKVMLRLYYSILNYSDYHGGYS